jgi:hypothetical protein
MWSVFTTVTRELLSDNPTHQGRYKHRTVTRFSFQPLPPIQDETLQRFAEVASPLASLAGKRTGPGFNVIWCPVRNPNQDRFLKLNVTSEQLAFTGSPACISPPPDSSPVTSAQSPINTGECRD